MAARILILAEPANDKEEALNGGSLAHRQQNPRLQARQVIRVHVDIVGEDEVHNRLVQRVQDRPILDSMAVLFPLMGDWFGGMIDWANRNAGFTALAFAVVSSVLVGTTVYLSYLVTRATQAAARAAEATAILTSRLVDETVQLRQVETDPDIAVYIEMQRFSSNVIDLVVRNVGRGSAHDLRFQLDPPEGISWQDATGQVHSLLDVSLIRDGLEYMAPDQEKRFLYGPHNGLPEHPLTITAIYRGKHHPRDVPPFRDVFTIDTAIFNGIYVPTNVPEISIPRSLKKIADGIQRLASGRAPLLVNLRRNASANRSSSDREMPELLEVQELARKLLARELTVDDLSETP